MERLAPDRLGEGASLGSVAPEDHDPGVVVLHGQSSVVFRLADLAGVLARLYRGLRNAPRPRQASGGELLGGARIDEYRGLVMARDVPGRCAVDFPALGIALTYGGLDHWSRRLARGLVALGVAYGDRVAVWAANSPDWIALQFAVARIGAVLVPVNPQLAPPEIAFVLNLSVETVETHRAQFMERLGIRDVAGLVRYALRTGLIPPEG